MSEKPTTTTLDLSVFDDLDGAARPTQALVTNPVGAQAVVAVPIDERLAPQPPADRLVDVSKMNSEDLAAASDAAAAIDFHKSNSLLAHGDGVLADIAQASRQLLAGVRLGEAGDVGRIAATVLDGVKILRIQDLQAESAAAAPAARKGFVGKPLRSRGGRAHSDQGISREPQEISRSYGC